ncbi:MAG TPA: hypothetical protein PKM57_10860, partial [Kiritimatiellia bacterium]|nr:hypothetical protein [Kiritimatiellia bacterium]
MSTDQETPEQNAQPQGQPVNREGQPPANREPSTDAPRSKWARFSSRPQVNHPVARPSGGGDRGNRRGGDGGGHNRPPRPPKH